MQHRVRLWIAGSRPKTLPAAVVPVAVGFCLVVARHDSSLTLPLNAFLALVVSLALQVGVNYANDYSDGVKGTDARRVGPLRLVGSGAMPAPAVKRAAFVSFLVAAVAGLAIAATTSWWLIAVGVVSIVAAWTYTGGPSPYGYAGLGELFVFVFFGVVATLGTTFAVSESIRVVDVIASCAVGFLAVALLIVNNLRDIPTDAVAGKRTLAVRLGDARTRSFYGLLCLASAVFVVAAAVQRPAAVAGIVGLAAVRPAWVAVRSGATGRELIAVLGATGRAQMAFGLAFSIGLVLGG